VTPPAAARPVPRDARPGELAAFLDVSVSVLLNARDNDPTFPKPRMIGTLPHWTKRRILACPEDVDGGLDEPASDAPTPDRDLDQGEQTSARSDDAKRSAKQPRAARTTRGDPFRVLVTSGPSARLATKPTRVHTPSGPATSRGRDPRRARQPPFRRAKSAVTGLGTETGTQRPRERRRAPTTTSQRLMWMPTRAMGPYSSTIPPGAGLRSGPLLSPSSQSRTVWRLRS
jgi:hypothetical protein